MIDASKIILAPTKVFYLRMDQPPSENFTTREDVSFKPVPKPIDVTDYLAYYASVGSQFNWVDRFIMAKGELRSKINADNVDIYVMEVGEQEAGFLELGKETDYVELMYFGLFPKFIGTGLGKYFLEWSIHKAWSYSPKWIQLNTCELDHANALPTYRKLGFKEYKTTIEQRRVQAK